MTLMYLPYFESHVATFDSEMFYASFLIARVRVDHSSEALQMLPKNTFVECSSLHSHLCPPMSIRLASLCLVCIALSTQSQNPQCTLTRGYVWWPCPSICLSRAPVYHYYTSQYSVKSYPGEVTAVYSVAFAVAARSRSSHSPAHTTPCNNIAASSHSCYQPP